MSALLVVEPGLHATVQDRGRFGYQALGVPVAGALDTVALALVNAVAGNDAACAGLEFLYRGPTLEAADGALRLAASVDMTLAGETPRRLPAWQSVTLAAGQRVRLEAPAGCACGYLAIAGGLALEPVLGSLSTYTRSRIGGFEGRALRAGDRLPLAALAPPAGDEQRLEPLPELAPARSARVVPGPQADWFTEAALRDFLGQPFKVSAEADRMGLRLEGPVLEHAKGYNIVSDGIATGAVQVPGSGQPIVLLADHQTTGGYPKIATVISADLPALGRLRPGDPLRFEAVDVATAERAARELAEDLARRCRGLVRAAPPTGVDEAALLNVNLISGAVDAFE